MTFKRVGLWLILLFFVATVSGSLWFIRFAFTPAEGDKGESVAVVIPKGSTVQEINRILASEHLVAKDIRFLLLTKYLGVTSKIKAGEFALHRGQNPKELLFELVAAKPIQHPVTIPEGLVIDEIAAIFAEGGWCDQETYIRLAHDTDFIKSLGFESIDSLEGYLFPDTYYLTHKGQETADIIRMQVRRHRSVWKALVKDQAIQLTPFEVLILASMVESEAGRADERPIIAGVFLNRLQKGMRLQSDPTVMYGIENFSGPLSKTDLHTATPYNTYTLKRLPIGPICNPGKDALQAVLTPQKTDYLYFVSKGGGRHYFSKTLREHNRAVYKYLRKPRKNRKKK